MGKTKASVTATAKAKSKEAASAKAKAAASLISTALVDASPKCKARCQINRRDIEGQVQRALENAHFKHLSPYAKMHKLVENKTLPQHLTEMLECLDRNIRIGSTKYTSLARKFSDNATGVGALQVADPTEPLDDVLLDRLNALEGDTQLHLLRAKRPRPRGHPALPLSIQTERKFLLFREVS